MKLTNIALGLFTAAAIFMVGCSATQTVSEESLGLRKTSLYTESDAMPVKTEYSKKAAGESQIIARAFENAPPMIPHTVDGMLPITINNNACTGCHVPGVAESMNATPIPQSHFTNFRPDTSLASNGMITKEGKTVVNTSDFKTVGKKQLWYREQDLTVLNVMHHNLCQKLQQMNSKRISELQDIIKNLILLIISMRV